MLIYDTTSDSHRTDKPIYNTTSNQHKADFLINNITSDSHNTDKPIYNTTSNSQKTDKPIYDTTSSSHTTDKPIYDATPNPHKGTDNTNYGIITNNPLGTVRFSNNFTTSSDETHYPSIGNSLDPLKTNDITDNPMRSASGHNDQRFHDTTDGVLSTSGTWR